MMLKIDYPDTIFAEAKAVALTAILNRDAEAGEVYKVEPKAYGFVVRLYEDDDLVGTL